MRRFAALLTASALVAALAVPALGKKPPKHDLDIYDRHIPTPIHEPVILECDVIVPGDPILASCVIVPGTPIPTVYPPPVNK